MLYEVKVKKKMDPQQWVLFGGRNEGQSYIQEIIPSKSALWRYA